MMEPAGPVAPADLDTCGRGLHRPECVLALPSGGVLVPDWRGGVTIIAGDGRQHTCLARHEGPGLRPNGLSLCPDGSVLIANLGDAGGVWRLQADGALSPFLSSVGGVPLPPSNFVLVDGQERTWISVSTRQHPRQQAWTPHAADGFIVLADRRGARIVADGLQYTNEVRPDPSGTWLYAVETFGRRLTRFRIAPDGSLSGREAVVTLGHGCFPDGFAFDEAGGIWITSLVSNRLLRAAEGRVEVVLEDVNAAFVDDAERAFAAGTMTAGHLGPIPNTTLQQLTSVAFGGAGGRSVHLGTLHGTAVYRFRAGVRGIPEVHGPAFERGAFGRLAAG